MQAVKSVVFSFAILAATGCKQSAGSTEATGSNKPTPTQNTASNAPAAESATVPVDALPPTNTSRKTYLSTGVWKPMMAIQASDPQLNEKYQDKKLKFSPDQTFEVLQNGQVVGNGRWNFDEDNMKILLSSSMPIFNNTWKIMEKGFTMIWIGQTDENKTGAQIRWDCEK